ncbi:methyltransferase domain-containing protein [Lunatimonas salinarum]|uniref:methyltransferase domain-containing protein n=1 Tax=Lunatimonas salinarum TaxID=1774590 RepID=UPI001ADF834B|nr:methyltransferase domain-containing protein [Lunatimonas salinarum]
MNFQHRSYEKELMDAPNLSKADFHRNLQEIVLINRYLGGASVTYRGIRQLIRHAALGDAQVTDIGSGAGDLFDYLRRRFGAFPISFIAVDVQSEAKQFALEAFPDVQSQVSWKISDYRDVFEEEDGTDIVSANLFCHHLDDAELIAFLKGALRHARVGLVINDLHRHPFAYHSIRLLTSWFSQSHFTRHDAPLSVLRGFTRSEWHHALRAAGIQHYSLTWCWAFRHLLVIPKNPKV